MLSFFTRHDQADLLIGPEDGISLEVDAATIWAVKGDRRDESITVADAIVFWIDRDMIEEIE